jgi:hypothetical protein
MLAKIKIFLKKLTTCCCDQQSLQSQITLEKSTEQRARDDLSKGFSLIKSSAAELKKYGYSVKVNRKDYPLSTTISVSTMEVQITKRLKC